MPSTLSGRLALTYAILIVVLISGLGIGLVVSGERLYVDQLAEQLETEARIAARAVAPLIASDAASGDVDAQIKALGSGIEVRLAVVGPDGTTRGDSTRDPAAAPNLGTAGDVRPAIAAGMDGHDEAFRTSAGNSLAVSVPIPGGGGAVVRASLPLSDVDAAVGRMQRWIILAGLASTIAATGVAIFVARRITGPLEDLTRQSKALAGGNYDATVVPAGTQELGDLARAFNSMASQFRSSTRENERSRQRLETIFANLSDGVIIVDRDETVVSINAAAARILETSAQRAIGRAFAEVARDSDLIRLMRDGTSTEAAATATIDHARGGRVLEAAAQSVAGSSERLGILVLRDVTGIRRLEQVRREFVANVSHELRTPLASIRAVVETLEAGAIDDPEVSGDFLRRIVGEIDRLTALVNELLDLGRLESGRVQLNRRPVDPSILAGEAVERLRSQIDQAGLTLVTNLPAGLPAVSADVQRIEQVLLNLVHNAIKFTAAGGVITVSTAVAGREVEFRVADTGVGIAADELPRVFERFYKSDKARRSGGTGLGLAIAKHLVQAHEGAIRAESVLGQESLFVFTLPIAREPAS